MEQNESTPRAGLFIGINNYPKESGFLPLRYAERDAIEAAAVFREKCGVEPTILLGEEATYYTIDDILSKVGEGELFVFFFAGHGTSVKGHQYLVPVDGDTAGRRRLGLEELGLRWQNSFQYKNILALIDACRNEHYRQASRGGGGLETAVRRDCERIVRQKG